MNAGPQAYATAFLEPSQALQFPDERVEELKDGFRWVSLSLPGIVSNKIPYGIYGFTDLGIVFG